MKKILLLGHGEYPSHGCLLRQTLCQVPQSIGLRVLAKIVHQCTNGRGFDSAIPQLTTRGCWMPLG